MRARPLSRVWARFWMMAMVAAAGCTTATATNVPEIGGSSLTTNRANVAASGVDSAVVTATLRQTSGVLVPNTAVIFNATDAQVTPSSAVVTDANGNASVTLTSTLAGEHVVTLSVIAGSTQTDAGLQLSVNFYSPAIMNSNAILIGTALNAEIKPLNDDGSVNTTFIGGVHFSSSDPLAKLPGEYTMSLKDHGAAVVSGLVLQTPGVQTVSAIESATGLVLSTQTFFLVASSSKSGFEVNAPTTIQVGIPFDSQVTAVDPAGQTRLEYMGTVTITCTDANAILPSATLVFDANSRGKANYHGLTLNSVGAFYISARDPSGAVGITAVQVSPGPPARLLVNTASTATAGVATDASAQIVDAQGNPTAYIGTVVFISDDANAILPPAFGLTAADVGGRSFTGGVVWQSTDRTY